MSKDLVPLIFNLFEFLTSSCDHKLALLVPKFHVQLFPMALYYVEEQLHLVQDILGAGVHDSGRQVISQGHYGCGVAIGCS